MRDFARLFRDLDGTTRATDKVAALEAYFRRAEPADAAWALWFLSGQRLRRLVKTLQLRQWAAEAADLPLWLVEECYEQVGDLAETLALLLPVNPHPRPPSLAALVEQRLMKLAGATEATQRGILRDTWADLDPTQRLLWHKLITGSFRVGVSRALLVRALAGLAGVEPSVMTHRLLGDWRPTAAHFQRLLSPDTPADDPARPYPFYLASPLETDAATLGDTVDWQVEWKWDGIRAQLLRRAGEAALWSRGEEFMTVGFPEVIEAARALPEGTVLDGELLAWREERPLPFSQLQRRLNRREAGLALRREVPVVFMAYDLLECAGADVRSLPLAERRRRLEAILQHALASQVKPPAQPENPVWTQPDLFMQPTPPRVLPVSLRLSPALTAGTWSQIADWQAHARTVGAEGLMLKHRNSAYGTGRQRGAWWKWKVAPFTCDAVLVAAQPGHGRRATLFTDYTFAVWDGDELVPVAKAYSGLTDAEIDAVDTFVRANTTGRFGPVRQVKPELVFELAFDAVAQSTRHRAGLGLRFPRIARWRHDKKPAEADTVQTLRALAPSAPG